MLDNQNCLRGALGSTAQPNVTAGAAFKMCPPILPSVRHQIPARINSPSGKYRNQMSMPFDLSSRLSAGTGVTVL